MAGSPGKTPVSLLQEICTRKNCNPKYELLQVIIEHLSANLKARQIIIGRVITCLSEQVEGAVHEPVFQYRLFLNFNGADLDSKQTRQD